MSLTNPPADLKPEIQPHRRGPAVQRPAPAMIRALKAVFLGLFGPAGRAGAYRSAPGAPEQIADRGVCVEWCHRIPLARGDNNVENRLLLCPPGHDGKGGRDGLPGNMTEAE